MFKTFVSEVRRRNVLPTLLPYVGLVWLLLQVVSVIQPMLNMHQLVGTFVAIVLFAGFPVVAYLSWYFNFTWDGLEPIPDLESGAPSRFGKRNWLGLTAIVLLSGWLGFVYFNEVKQDLVKQEEGIRQVKSATSIAVLPFRDLSPDQDQAFITEGLTEELTSLLGKVSELNVAAASSTFALAKRDLTPVDIGRRLQVDTIVTGSLRVTGNRLKIRTELIDSGDGMTLWTETFNREFKDIFAVEEEISRSIVNLLEDRYLEAGEVTSAAKTAVTDAYVMYLKGREQYRLQTTEGMKHARKYFEQAIALDPEYVAAYVGLADTLLMLEKGKSRFGILDTDIAINLAEQQLIKAFVRDQSNARSYAIQGKLFELKQDFDAAISSFDKAISINPSLAIAYMWRFTVMRQVNRHSDALISIKKALELDPISVSNLYNMGLAFSLRGEIDEATRYFTKLSEEFPSSPLGYAGMANSAFLNGELAKSAEYWFYATEISPDNENYQFNFITTLISLQLPELVERFTENPIYYPNLLILRGKYRELFEEMDFRIKSNPDDPWLKFEAGWYHLLFESQDIGVDLLLQSYDGFTDNDMFSMPMCSPAIEIAYSLGLKGRIRESKKYLEKCHELNQEAKKSLIVDSFSDHLSFRLSILEGDKNLAVNHLQLAIDNGWREWWTDRDPILQKTEITPEIQALFDFIRLELHAEREKAKLFFMTIDSKKSNQKQTQ